MFRKGNMGKQAGHWKGGVKKMKNGYTMIYCPNHPRAKKYPYVYVVV
jgi:hypothetical protein